MAKILFKKKPERVPDSLYFAHLLNAAQTVTACTKDPSKAEHLAELLYTSAMAFIAGVPDETKPCTAKVDLKKWKAYARLRLKFDRANFRILRDAIVPNTSLPGLLTTLRTVDLLIADLDRAYSLAPPLDDERERELPEIELPDPAPVPARVNYTEILDDAKATTVAGESKSADEAGT